MSMQILRTEDPRDPLEKARRPEIFSFAKANNVTEITPEMPAMLMRRILRTKGLTNIRIPKRVLGQQEFRPQPTSPHQPSIEQRLQGAEHEIDALDDLARQFQAQPKPEPAPVVQEERKLFRPRSEAWREKKLSRMDFYDMVKAAKANNIHMKRTDGKRDLKAKLKEASIGV